jgi:hypothetical protein
MKDEDIDVLCLQPSRAGTSSSGVLRSPIPCFAVFTARHTSQGAWVQTMRADVVLLAEVSNECAG